MGRLQLCIAMALAGAIVPRAHAQLAPATVPKVSVPLQAPAPLAEAAGPAAAQADRMLPVEVTVNGAKQGSWVLLERQGLLYAPLEALVEWRLQANPAAGGITYRNTPYIPLSGLAGYSAKIDFPNQAVDLTFSPQAFIASRLSTELGTRPELTPVLPGVFLNYDLSFTSLASRGSASVNDLGVVAEIGYATALGVLTSTHVGRGLIGAPGAAQSGWVRLETTFTRDFPKENRTIRIGDTATRAGIWGRNVYFGGLQLGSNYGLSPGMLTQSIPLITGVSSAPSTVELYVNDTLRQVSRVPSGPFVIENYSALTGGGEARLVVRDVLGRETVITQPFFTSKQLLARGLDDWSLETGFLRRNVGTESNAYGSVFSSGTWNRGVSNDLTMEGHYELSRATRAVGAGMVAAAPFNSLLTASLAASDHEEVGRGRLWVLGLQRQTLRLGAYLQAQAASVNFRQLGQPSTFASPRLQVAGSITYTSGGGLGTYGLGFATVERYGAERIMSVTGSYTQRFGERSSVTLTASRAVAGAGGHAITASVIVPLDRSQVITATAAARGGQHDAYVSSSVSPQGEDGLGWRVLAGQQSSEARAEGNLYYLGRYGRATADVSASQQQTALRLGGTGGFVFTAGRVFATRRVDESFAVVEVPGYADVGIGLGSNVLTRTDKDGIALVPRLMAYQSNSLRVDPKDLPISAELDTIELTAVPSWRSGVKVTFPVRAGRGALLKLVLDDGEPVPPGAVVNIEGDKTDFYVARRGETFVTGLQTENRIVVTWNNQRCPIVVTLPPSNPDDIPRLGPYACKGVSR